MSLLGDKATLTRERSDAMSVATAVSGAGQGHQRISVVVPTYQEAANLAALIDRIDSVRRTVDLELIIVDDDSRDGTVELIESRNEDWIHLIVRRGRRDLSKAVLEGLRAAKHEFLVVMDADLSHPPEMIPEMVHELSNGADFVIGSRYVSGGQLERGWGAWRWLNSRAATLMARCLCSVADPLSGAFALRRETLSRARHLNPIGYKIGLELMIKCRCSNVREIPITFGTRKCGESKLTTGERLRFIQHLRRLFIYKYGTRSEILQFGVIGTIGTIVNLGVLSALLGLSVDTRLAVALAIVVAMAGNFVLNRRFTFSYARKGPIGRHVIGYASSCGAGAALSFVVTLLIIDAVPGLRWPQIAALIGITVGTIANFLLSKYVVFRGVSPVDRAPDRLESEDSTAGPVESCPTSR